VEVAAADHLAAREHERVVGGRVDLDAQHPFQLGQGIARGAVNLRHASQAVGVLDAVLRIGPMRRPDLAVGQQRTKVAGRCHLAGMRPRRDQLLGEGGARAEHGLQAHGPHHVGGERESQRVVVGERPDARHELRAVQQRQALFGSESDGLQPGPSQRLRPGTRPGAVDRRLSLADEDEGEVGERGQVARRAEAAARGNHRVDGPVEHADQELGQRHPDTGQPDGERVGAQQEQGAHHFVRQRIADPGGMRPDEVALQLGGLRGLDPDVRQIAEAGRHPVHGRSIGHQPIDDVARGGHAVRGIGVERHGPPSPCDLDHVVDGEVTTGERKRRHRSLYYAPCDGCRISRVAS
jgi:hypothetical protein